ncbi:hypothetical protein HYW67_02225 [Candidatus Parcubacteria bacterium]|nr:hypothetical protein [Candidatus Parcubacteria bacterium]
MPQKRVLEKIRRLHQAFLNGELGSLIKHEVHPELPSGSRENYLYFTLPCCINFQRNSPALWQSALTTYQDPTTNYLFFPEKIRARRPQEVRRDLVQYRLALQTNTHPNIWTSICATLRTHYENNPRNILAEGGYDVCKVIQNLQHHKKHLFPYLGGIKLSNYWLFIISRFTDAPLENVEEISIIPDAHVVRSTVKLGLARPGVTPGEIEAIWRPIVKKLVIRPGEMHSALWRWSRDRFVLEL